MDRNASWLPVQPNYFIYKFTDQIYKVCYFPSGAPSGIRSTDTPHKHYDKKLDASISRSRRIILELGLCNDWDYFGTFTLDGSKFDRSDLNAFRKSFSQFIRDYRKKAKAEGLNSDIRFLLIPELHADGQSWHMHGLFSGIEPFLVSFSEWAKLHPDIPRYLIDNGYFNWPDYQAKFGFCSFGSIQNKVACGFYICKYLYKGLSSGSIAVGNRTIFHSIGLNRSVLHGDIYGHCDYLDQFLVNKYEFCHTGFTHVDHQLGWEFALEYMDIQPFDTFPATESDVDDYYNFTQLAIKEYDSYETS